MTDQAEDCALSIRDLGFYYPADNATLQAALLQHARVIGQRFRSARSGIRASEPGTSGTNGRERWIFRNLSFDVARGEVFGIIGRNGCGKTTLLKIFARVLFPVEGSVTIHGRVAALLAVGTGFHVDYTGRENVFLNGMILGLSRGDIQNRFDDIVAFADIGAAIDMPVRTYSSGMRARLAFAVAAQLNSEIVILDEVLSVGDAGFRDRSLSVIQQMKRDGRTVILVSHNMSAIDTYCDRAMVIGDGLIQEIGKPKNVIKDYLESFHTADAEEIPLRERQDREGSGAIRIVDYALETRSGLTVHEPQAGDDLIIALDYETAENNPVYDVDLGVAFFSDQGYKLSRFATENLGSTFAELAPKGRISLHIPRFPYARGNYLVGFRATAGGELADYIPNAFKVTVGDGDFYGTGVVDDHSPVLVPHDWAVTLPSAIAELDSKTG